MGSVKLKGALALLCILVLWAFQGLAEEKTENQDKMTPGTIEIECNISLLELRLCPHEKFQKKEKSVLFGLIKSEKRFCSGGEISLGATPVKPTPVPPGKYLLMIPQGYRWEHDGPIEIDVETGKRNYFLLKVFSSSAHRSEDDNGAGGGGGSAGGGRP